jgi:SARP family transcriptional regulator, regulator of embCAB operon
MAAHRFDEVVLVVAGDLVSAFAAQNVVVGHGTADTWCGEQEGGKRKACSRQGVEAVAVRVSLTERLSIEGGGVVVGEQRFPRQGRLVFAYLLAADGKPVPKDELAEALWGDELPARWEKGLTVLVSKLRALLNECDVDGSTALTSAFGCYQLILPPGSWIDIAAADEAANAAEQALAAGNADAAWLNASTAESLAHGTFLPGEDAGWVSERRAELREILVRALECLAEANRMRGDPAAAVRAADELIILEPFRESGYRLLMKAQSAAGNDAEALRTYERCRALLSEELGAYPSPETESVYLEILQSPPRSSAAQPDQGNLDGPRSESPPLAIGKAPTRDRRKLAALTAAALLVAGVAAAAFVLTSGDAAPAAVLPNSLVRIDPHTLQPTQVARIGRDPDLVVVAGGFVWVANLILAYTGPDTPFNGGDRTLTRIDPSTGEVKTVGGLAPCGLTADPSGDVWVANCFVSGSGPVTNVVRVDARTLKFERTWQVPPGDGYFRGLAYGGGSLWVAGTSGAVTDSNHQVTQVDPRTGHQRSIELDRHAGWLAWSEGYGDLWMNDFDAGSVSRMHAATGVVGTSDSIGRNPATIVVEGDSAWVGDWNLPQVVRLPAVGSGRPRRVSLPASVLSYAGVTTVAAGAGSVWATVPSDRAVWRIDPTTSRRTRITLPYAPWGVAAGDDDIWVVVRGKGS